MLGGGKKVGHTHPVVAGMPGTDSCTVFARRTQTNSPRVIFRDTLIGFNTNSSPVMVYREHFYSDNTVLSPGGGVHLIYFLLLVAIPVHAPSRVFGIQKGNAALYPVRPSVPTLNSPYVARKASPFPPKEQFYHDGTVTLADFPANKSLPLRWRLGCGVVFLFILKWLKHQWNSWFQPKTIMFQCFCQEDNSVKR